MNTDKTEGPLTKIIEIPSGIKEPQHFARLLGAVLAHSTKEVRERVAQELASGGQGNTYWVLESITMRRYTVLIRLREATEEEKQKSKNQI